VKPINNNNIQNSINNSVVPVVPQDIKKVNPLPTSSGKTYPFFETGPKTGFNDSPYVV
jgi:hypothetical protein